MSQPRKPTQHHKHRHCVISRSRPLLLPKTHTHTHTFCVCMCVYVVEPSIGAGVSPSKVTHLPEVSYFCCFFSAPTFFFQKHLLFHHKFLTLHLHQRTFPLCVFLSACQEVSFLLSSPFTCQKEIDNLAKVQSQI